MNAVISDLANLIKAKRKEQERFVLMLGAGASISSGVKPTASMQDEILRQFGQGIPGDKIDDRFDVLWGRSNPSQREIYLQPYLDVPPGQGYLQLARLIKEGYFDLALTFNFDNLLEQALIAVDFRDYSVLVRGEIADDQMQKLIDAKEPRFKLVKLHGSVKGSKHFLFDTEEMYQYPAPIEAMINLATSRDIVVCGYAFNDYCVIRSFADQGGSIVCVNPGGVPKGVRVKVKNRKSESWAIKSDFDGFCHSLFRELLEHPGAEPEVRLPNPFKFLESYEEDDRDVMLGREEETERFVRALNRKPRVIVVSGQRKAGKTSFVRARLIPWLDAQHFDPIYLRCQRDLEVSLPRQLTAPGDGQAGPTSLPETLQAIANRTPGRHSVLFLDQFDRVTSRFDWQTRQGLNELSAYLKEHVWAGTSDELTVVLVVSDESTLGGWLCQECAELGLPASLVMCVAFDNKEVLHIIQTMAKTAGYEFDPAIFEDMARNYEQSRNTTLPERNFTLAHIQAICHLLAGKQKVDYPSYEVVAQNLNALHQAINVVDIISFVEDLGWPDAAWMRAIIKVPLKESKERIAEFIRKHYEDIRPGAVRTRPRPGQPAPQPPTLT
jgi:NAD-dependent SIR2 family protein deacetylase